MDEASIFVEALKRPSPGERAAFLDRACGGNDELRRSVELLLRAHDKAGGFLADSPAPAGVTVDQPITESPGTAIGPYELLEPIGEGGMGTVWMAQQTAPVRRLVAVKLIKAGMDSKQVIARFEAERQALALMDHPNIARVLDAGATPEDRPYFVMELVKGLSLTRYCDERRMSLRERLELFVPVCQAVQHAHQKGVIHRDLKPSNVLVAPYDGVPIIKVIDFGVAKAAGQPLTERTLATGFGAVVGTLEYMSPEQAELNNLDIDTRSDVYALGVLLYELLTGTTPLPRKRLEAAAFVEVLRIIREEEPPRPSTRLSTTEELPSIAANRGAEPGKLTGLVRGELDWIVMKALEKDRGRRYETANGLAMDLHRYLADEPVTAGPPSTRYRLRKFVRRNRGPVMAVILIALTLVAGIIGTTWGMVEARRRAEGERRAKQRAEANFALANEAVEKYLGTVTDDPDLKRADFNRLRKKLLESALPFFRKLTAQKSDDPEVEAGRGPAYRRLGEVRQAMGENEAALQDFEAERAIFVRLNADFPTVPAYRHELAVSLTRVGYSLIHLGKRREAEAVYRQAQDILKKLAAESRAEPKYRSCLANTHDHLGLVLAELGQREEAEAFFRQAVAIGETLAAGFPTVRKYRLDLACSHHNLGYLLNDLVEKRGEAGTAYRQALDLRAKLAAEFQDEPEYRRDLAQSHNDLGLLLKDLGEYESAQEHYAQAVAIQEKLAADFPTVPEYRQVLAMSHHNLGNLMLDLDRRQDAATAFGQALALFEKLAAEFRTVPAYRQMLATSHGNRGNALMRLGKRPEAEADYRRAIDIKETLAADFPTAPADAVSLGGGYCNFGNWVLDGGQPEKALGWFRKAIATLEPVVNEERRLVDARLFLRNSHWGRAIALDDLGRHAEATRDWERAVELDDGGRKATFRIRIYRNKKDAAGCLAAAADYEALRRTDAGGLYDSACHRAICAAVLREDPKTPRADAPRLAKEQADQAMARLRKAVAAGFADAAHMREDEDLDALRGREDFKGLLDELQTRKQ